MYVHIFVYVCAYIYIYIYGLMCFLKSSLLTLKAKKKQNKTQKPTKPSKPNSKFLSLQFNMFNSQLSPLLKLQNIFSYWTRIFCVFLNELLLILRYIYKEYKSHDEKISTNDWLYLLVRMEKLF